MHRTYTSSSLFPARAISKVSLPSHWRRLDMEEAPLASLSLTHVHYVSPRLSILLPTNDVFRIPMILSPIWPHGLPLSRRAYASCMSRWCGHLARSRCSSCSAARWAVRCWTLASSDGSGRKGPNVWLPLSLSAGSNWLSGRRNVRQRLWHAFLARTIRCVLLSVSEFVSVAPTRSDSTDELFTVVVCGEAAAITCRMSVRCCRGG